MKVRRLITYSIGYVAKRGPFSVPSILAIISMLVQIFIAGSSMEILTDGPKLNHRNTESQEIPFIG